MCTKCKSTELEVQLEFKCPHCSEKHTQDVPVSGNCKKVYCNQCSRAFVASLFGGFRKKENCHSEKTKLGQQVKCF